MLNQYNYKNISIEDDTKIKFRKTKKIIKPISLKRDELGYCLYELYINQKEDEITIFGIESVETSSEEVNFIIQELQKRINK